MTVLNVIGIVLFCAFCFRWGFNYCRNIRKAKRYIVFRDAGYDCRGGWFDIVHEWEGDGRQNETTDGSEDLDAPWSSDDLEAARRVCAYMRMNSWGNSFYIVDLTSGKVVD